jgi:hypothetical protein
VPFLGDGPPDECNSGHVQYLLVLKDKDANEHCPNIRSTNLRHIDGDGERQDHDETEKNFAGTVHRIEYHGGGSRF